MRTTSAGAFCHGTGPPTTTGWSREEQCPMSTCPPPHTYLPPARGCKGLHGSVCVTESRTKYPSFSNNPIPMSRLQQAHTIFVAVHVGGRTQVWTAVHRTKGEEDGVERSAGAHACNAQRSTPQGKESEGHGGGVIAQHPSPRARHPCEPPLTGHKRLRTSRGCEPNIPHKRIQHSAS